MGVEKITWLELVVVVRKCFIRFSSHQEDQANYPTSRIQMMEDSGDCRARDATDLCTESKATDNGNEEAQICLSKFVDPFK